MKIRDQHFLEMMSINLDSREEAIRSAVYKTLNDLCKPDLSDQIVITYWVHAATLSPAQVGEEISYHMTSGVRKAPAGSLLERCTGRVVDAVEWDHAGRMGVVRVGFPLEMLLNARGQIYSTDILHITAGEGVFGLTENIDIKLCDIAMSDKVLRLFPGPAYGSSGLRKKTDFGDEIAFGTILKPCTGITADELAAIVEEAAGNPMFLFVKEDENFLPGVPFAPLKDRLKAAQDAIRRSEDKRGKVGLVYAPHVTAPPDTFADNVKLCIEAGATGIMFSDLFTGGSLRLARELCKSVANPPAIYAHNSGISNRTRHVYREVLDMFVRLDGGDFRQTAPVTTGKSLLRPFGLEWRKCEEILSGPLGGHPPVMMARAGGLDQGNIIINLLDVERGAGSENYLFLAGSAINGIKNASGEYDPALGAEAMRQAVQVYHDRIFSETTGDHAQELKSYADTNGLDALAAAIAQRYGL